VHPPASNTPFVTYGGNETCDDSPNAKLAMDENAATAIEHAVIAGGLSMVKGNCVERRPAQ
jgi:hypothetical protein